METKVKRWKVCPRDGAVRGFGSSLRPLEVGPRCPAYVDKKSTLRGTERFFGKVTEPCIVCGRRRRELAPGPNQRNGNSPMLLLMRIVNKNLIQTIKCTKIG